MYRHYSQRVSMAVVAIVGCIALWTLVIAFTNMNNEISQIQKDLAILKVQAAPSTLQPEQDVPSNTPSLSQ